MMEAVVVLIKLIGPSSIAGALDGTDGRVLGAADISIVGFGVNDVRGDLTSGTLGADAITLVGMVDVITLLATLTSAGGFDLAVASLFTSEMADSATLSSHRAFFSGG